MFQFFSNAVTGNEECAFRTPKMSHIERTDWERPEGVCCGNWEYINDDSIAAGYDQSLVSSPLVLMDQRVIGQHLPSEPGVAIDFGCGTGRNALPLMELGWEVIGIDLSVPMLKRFRDKLTIPEKASLVHANLLQLEGMRSSIGDFGQCMFSTFGMIQGTARRQQFLHQAARLLKKDAPLVIHAHNYWRHLRIRGGLRWLVMNAVNALRGRCELGDRFADYRTVNQMMLHHFSLRSFKRELLAAGFTLDSAHAILPDEEATRKVSRGSTGKAVGWILVGRAP